VHVTEPPTVIVPEVLGTFLPNLLKRLALLVKHLALNYDELGRRTHLSSLKSASGPCRKIRGS
jgi:hypothetical protein